MTSRALIILHPGFEEIEAVTPIDLLSRAGVDVVQASTGDELLVEGRSGITLRATHLLKNLVNDFFDVVIVPGGPGIAKLRNDPTLCNLLKRHSQQASLIACICAAPLLLLDAGLIEGISYTAHPSTAQELPSASTASIVIDGNYLTSSGAGTATEFGLALVQRLRGADCAIEIAQSICWRHTPIHPTYRNQQ